MADATTSEAKSVETPVAPAAAPSVKFEKLKTIELRSTALGFDISPDGKTLYAACLDGGVYKIDSESGKAREFGRHDSYASGVKLIPGTEQAVTCGYDGALQWHDVGAERMTRRVEAHEFFIWDMDVSRDGKWVATSSGQYLAGGYKYEPAPATEPTVKVFDAHTGELKFAFHFTPPVYSVAFSPDGAYVAAGNMMGDVRVWDVNSGAELAAWNTPDLVTWGISKSAYYCGGVYGMCFSPDAADVYVSGLRTMYDPQAANGRQMWQRFAWRESPVRKAGEIHSDDSGAGGVMEALKFHPSKRWFVLAGRLVFGKWSLGAFDATNGNMLESIDIEGTRAVEVAFNASGDRMFVAGGISQNGGRGRAEDKNPDGNYTPFGRIVVFSVAT